MKFDRRKNALIGTHGSLALPKDDDVARRFAMLMEGECEGLGATKASQKYGLSTQRYFQLRKIVIEQGISGLISKRRGPKTKYRRTAEVERQVIRHRFLDPDASVEVIAQKISQTGLPISIRSVERIIEDYGLQKKTLSVSPRS